MLLEFYYTWLPGKRGCLSQTERFIVYSTNGSGLGKRIGQRNKAVPPLTENSSELHGVKRAEPPRSPILGIWRLYNICAHSPPPSSPCSPCRHNHDMKRTQALLSGNMDFDTGCRCVINISKPQFPPLQNGNNDTSPRILWDPKV